MKPLIAIALAAAVAGCATDTRNLPTQSGVDLGRYAGRWYEQVRLPHGFQKDCASDVRADYTLQPDGRIGVVNQCRTAQGKTKVAGAQGRLSPAFDPPDPARLQVRFAPQWMSWLPWVWGDYWILHVDEDYRYALVGTPDRKYLWVLARDRQADRAMVNRLLDRAAKLGFDVTRVVRTGN